MENLSDKVLYAIDFKHKSFENFIKKHNGLSYLQSPRLHEFCKKINLDLYPYKLQTDIDIKESRYVGYECIIETSYSKLEIDVLKRNAIRNVSSFHSIVNRRQRKAEKDREKLREKIILAKDNRSELRKLGSLYSFDVNFINEVGKIIFFKTKEIIHVPYKIIFLDIAINHFSEIVEKYKDYELLKLVTELKILNSSLKSTIIEEKKISKNKISLPHQIALLNELGFFELEFFKNISDHKRNQIISKLLNANVRSIKGNISALDPNSKENLSKYTSYNYMEEVKKYLFKL